jgi:hypothetical protein
MKLVFSAIASLFVFSILVGKPSQTQSEDLKLLDDFFRTVDYQKASGCTDSAWAAIYTAARSNLQNQNLPESSPQTDMARAKEIGACFETASNNRDQAFKEVRKELHNDLLFNDYYGASTTALLAATAQNTYFSHADDIRYRNLVDRYNALANSLANVRLAQGSSFPIQPRALHCESSTNPATKITQLDCQ